MSEDPQDKTQVLSRAPVTVSAKVPPARLTCVDKSVLKDGVGAQISLEDGEVSVGRDAENKVSLQAQGVSRYHARVFCENGHWAVEDLGSTNGTRINNSKLESKQSLTHGDTVAFGRACYKFQVLDEEKKEGAAAKDVDLGAGEKTVVLRRKPAASPPPVAPKPAPPPVAKPAAPKPAPPPIAKPATPKPAPPPIAKPATPAATPSAEQRPAAPTAKPVPQKPAATPAAKTPGAKANATKKSDGSGAILWIIVVVLFAAIVIGGAKFLGFF